MTEFLDFMAGMREYSRYILTRGLILASALLAASLAVYLRARSAAADGVLLLSYADCLQRSALTVLGAGLIGSALLEDVLETRGIP